MNWVEAIGYAGTILTVASSAMSTMIPLRIVALTASCVVIVYGLLIGSFPVVLTEIIQIPFNAWRLYQMLRLVKDVEKAASGDLSDGAHQVAVRRTLLSKVIAQLFHRRAFAGQPVEVVISRPPNRVQQRHQRLSLHVAAA